MLSNFTLFQSGLPGWVRLFNPVIKHRFSFWYSRSNAIWRPTAFMSELFKAEVIYMWISRNLSCSSNCACSISNSLNKFTNHSNALWWRLSQKKSTLKEKLKFKKNQENQIRINCIKFLICFEKKKWIFPLVTSCLRNKSGYGAFFFFF